MVNLTIFFNGSQPANWGNELIVKVNDVVVDLGAQTVTWTVYRPGVGPDSESAALAYVTRVVVTAA